MNEENQRQQTQSSQSDSHLETLSAKQTIIDLFQTCDNEFQQNLKKFIEIYIDSDSVEQKCIEELDNFHYMLRDYECYLNAKIKSQKETISMFCSKIS
jgi:hypothetical protein